MYVLDTDHLSVLQRRVGTEYGQLRDRMRMFDVDDFCMTTVSLHEQTKGANSIIQRGTAKDVLFGYEMFQIIVADFARFRVLPFDRGALVKFEELRLVSRRIGTMDLRIASIALSHDMTVLTRNVRDFEQVPDLKFEDWTR